MLPSNVTPLLTVWPLTLSIEETVFAEVRRTIPHGFGRSPRIANWVPLAFDLGTSRGLLLS
jgi:hypothetical protein